MLVFHFRVYLFQRSFVVIKYNLESLLKTSQLFYLVVVSGSVDLNCSEEAFSLVIHQNFYKNPELNIPILFDFCAVAPDLFKMYNQWVYTDFDSIFSIGLL